MTSCLVAIYFCIFFIQDLVTLKSLESFTIMDTDEIHGVENVSAAQVDDFTVETSLEDLEFGFNIMKSTQKVSNISLHKLATEDVE